MTLIALPASDIDSLYVRPERRVSEVLISTAGGNEEVFGFYAKFGFFPSGHILRAEEGGPR